MLLKSTVEVRRKAHLESARIVVWLQLNQVEESRVIREYG